MAGPSTTTARFFCAYEDNIHDATDAQGGGKSGASLERLLYNAWRKHRIANSVSLDISSWPKQEISSILDLELPQLARELPIFWLEIRKEKGGLYCESSLDCFWAAIHRWSSWPQLINTGRRGFSEIHGTRNSEFIGPEVDSSGRQYIVYKEGWAKKNRTTTPVANRREPLFIYHEDFIETYLLYVSRKIPGAEPDKPFFTGKLVNPRGPYWYYKDLARGVNSVGSVIKKAADRFGWVGNITPHSGRVALANRLDERKTRTAEYLENRTGLTSLKTMPTGSMRERMLKAGMILDHRSLSPHFGQVFVMQPDVGDKPTDDPEKAVADQPDKLAIVPTGDDDINDDFLKEVAELEVAAKRRRAIPLVDPCEGWTPEVLKEVDDIIVKHQNVTSVKNDLSKMFQGASFTGKPVFNLTFQMPK
eukprot:jgi/Mesvir1/25756/Mv01935-RA.1